MAAKDVQGVAGVKDDTPAEVNFFFRRWLTFAWLFVNANMLFAIIFSPRIDADALRWIGVALIVSNVCVAFFYMAGASAVDMAKVFQGAAGAFARRRPRWDDSDDEPSIETPLAGDGKPI